MAYEISAERKITFVPGLSDSMFFAYSIILFALIILALSYISSLFMNIASATYDTDRFYAMARVIVNGGTPYLDYQDPKPPLIFFILTLPILLGQQFLGGLLLIGLCDLASTIVVMKIAWEFYGRSSGLFAGLLFVINIIWAQGYFIMTEPFTVLFILLATYFALCGKDKHYFISGLSLGIAVGFKQYAIIAVPLLLLVLYLHRDLKKAPAFLAGVALPLIIIFGLVFLVYGKQALGDSIYWSFGIAAPYVAGMNVNGIISSEITNDLELSANVMIASTLFMLTALALMRFRRYKRLNTGEIFFLLAALGFSSTIFIRQYLHYWVLALPFFAIFWTGWLLEEYYKKDFVFNIDEKADNLR